MGNKDYQKRKSLYVASGLVIFLYTVLLATIDFWIGKLFYLAFIGIPLYLFLITPVYKVKGFFHRNKVIVKLHHNLSGLQVGYSICIVHAVYIWLFHASESSEPLFVCCGLAFALIAFLKKSIPER